MGFVDIVVAAVAVEVVEAVVVAGGDDSIEEEADDSAAHFLAKQQVRDLRFASKDHYYSPRRIAVYSKENTAAAAADVDLVFLAIVPFGLAAVAAECASD